MNLPKPESSIVIIKIGDSKKTIDIAKKIAENGFLIGAIRPPTVPERTARLRIALTLHVTQDDVDRLLADLAAEMARL